MTALDDRPNTRRTPAPREDWEYDHAHQACHQWMTAWRSQHPDAPMPPLRFADHVGRCARQLQDEGLGKVELARLFAAAAYDETCACGLTPDDIPPAPPTTKDTP